MMTIPIPPMPEPLPDAVLARRAALPLKPEPVVLEGRLVRLRPLDVTQDAEPLHALTNGSPIDHAGRHIDAYDADELVWRYMGGGPFETVGEFAAYAQGLVDLSNGLALAVIERTTGRQVGIACYINNAPKDLKIELGAISYSPVAQRTGANTETTYLMLKHAFALGYRRAEWKCNALNERSRAAALRLGFTFEGVQDAHMIVKGRRRDTAWFRILADEWDDVKNRLEALLARGDRREVKERTMLANDERQRRIGILRDFPARLAALVGGLTDEQLTTAYLPGEWTVAQNVHHLVDSHINSVVRLKLILTEDRPPLKGYDQDAWAVLPDVFDTPIAASLTILTGLHERWATLFASLTDEQRRRVGIHSEAGEMTPDDLLVNYSDHCDAHVDQIERTLAAGKG